MVAGVCLGCVVCDYLVGIPVGARVVNPLAHPARAQMTRAPLMALAFALAGCGQAYTDADPTVPAFAAMAEWDEQVGVERPDLTIAIVWGDPDAVPVRQGAANPATGAVTLYRGCFREEAFTANVRHVTLHELVHVHVGPAHSPDLAALMYYRLTSANLNASLDPADIAKAQERWIRP